MRNAKAREMGYDVSLFKMLADAYPLALSTLRTQYRMNAEIMNLTNQLIYSNQLKCGSDGVASQTLSLHYTTRILKSLHENQAVGRVLDKKYVDLYFCMFDILVRLWFSWICLSWVCVRRSQAIVFRMRMKPNS